MQIEGIPVEAFFPLAEAARKIPGRRGKAISRATLERWRLRGLHGVILRCTRIGSRWFTCDNWLQEFLLHLNSPPHRNPVAILPRSGCQRRRAAEQARQTLKQAWEK